MLIEIDRYVKRLGGFPVVNTRAQKYLFTKSVSILVNKDEFSRKYIRLVQCYLLNREKISFDRVLSPTLSEEVFNEGNRLIEQENRATHYTSCKSYY